ncbi:MAG TPA: hypothetical protein VJ861_10330 [Treponemataceae bacterium]|nr:hypothetical protein [Treponemataceae bacterium]
MAKKKRKNNYYSWQTKRLLDFVNYEIQEIDFYESCYEKLERRVSLKVLSVMLFFTKKQYIKQPGSLITVYRKANQNTGIHIPFEERYEQYYVVLHDRGFI